MALRDGYSEEGHEAPPPEVSKRSRGLALVLSVFGGWFGLDRFYVGKISTAIPKLISFGGFGIWWLYDVILIATGEFRDIDNLPLRQWEVSSPPFTHHRLVARADHRLT